MFSIHSRFDPDFSSILLPSLFSHLPPRYTHRQRANNPFRHSLTVDLFRYWWGHYFTFDFFSHPLFLLDVGCCCFVVVFLSNGFPATIVATVCVVKVVDSFDVTMAVCNDAGPPWRLLLSSHSNKESERIPNVLQRRQRPRRATDKKKKYNPQ